MVERTCGEGGLRTTRSSLFGNGTALARQYLQRKAENIGLTAVRAAHGTGATRCTFPAQPPH